MVVVVMMVVDRTSSSSSTFPATHWLELHAKPGRFHTLSPARPTTDYSTVQTPTLTPTVASSQHQHTLATAALPQAAVALPCLQREKPGAGPGSLPNLLPPRVRSGQVVSPTLLTRIWRIWRPLTESRPFLLPYHRSGMASMRPRGTLPSVPPALHPSVSPPPPVSLTPMSAAAAAHLTHWPRSHSRSEHGVVTPHPYTVVLLVCCLLSTVTGPHRPVTSQLIDRSMSSLTRTKTWNRRCAQSNRSR